MQRTVFRRWRNAPCITIGLAIVNIICFLLVEFTGSSEDVQHMISCGAAYTRSIAEDHEYYRLFTSMFLHFGIAHLTNNMIVLVALGRYVERYVGHMNFLCFYLLSGLVGSWGSYLYHLQNDSNVVGAGASGAIFGIVGVMFALIVLHRGRLANFTMQNMLMFILLSVYQAVAEQSVDYVAHGVGFVSGAIIALLWFGYENLWERGRKR